MLPTLTTARCILRPIAATDFRLLADLAQDAEVMRYVRTPDLDDEGSRPAFERSLAMADAQGHGMWIVSEQGTDLGWVFLKAEIEGTPCHELGYRYLQKAWGRGIASEVATALADHARDALGFGHLFGITHPDNAASKRVLAKAGLSQIAGSYSIWETIVHLHTWGAIPRQLEDFIAASKI